MTVGKRVAVVSSKLLLVLLSFVPASKIALLGLKTFLCKSNKCVVGFVLVKMDFHVCGEI